MAWNDTPPTAAELKAAQPRWDSAPPTAEEMASVSPPKTIKQRLLDAITPASDSLAMRSLHMMNGAKDQPVAQEPSDLTDAVPSDESLKKYFSDKNLTEGAAPLAIPAAQAPAALLKMAAALGASAPKRIITTGAIGATHGLLRTPAAGEDRIGNAITEGGAAAAMSGLGEGISSAIPWLGAKFARLSKNQAEAYAADPAFAEDVYQKFKTDPETLSADISQQIKDAKNKIYETQAAPLLQKRGEMMTGKNVNISPYQFQGTVAEPEINRVFNTSGPTPEANPNPYGSAQLPIQLPEKLNITAPQAQRIKDMLQDAAYESSKAAQLNPLEYTSQSEADAAAASNMRKALEGAVPGIEDINAPLGRGARMSKVINQLLGSNPARILTNSESIGSVPIRTVQNYLDQGAGTNFTQQSHALDAAKAMDSSMGEAGLHKYMSEPSKIYHALMSPIGRNLLKVSNAVSPYLKTPVVPIDFADRYTSQSPYQTGGQ